LAEHAKDFTEDDNVLAQPANPLAHPDNQSIHSSPMMVAQG